MKAIERELKICDPCWDSRNSPIDQHGCGVVLQRSFDWAEVCDCPCREESPSDLTDPFDPYG